MVNFVNLFPLQASFISRLPLKVHFMAILKILQVLKPNLLHYFDSNYQFHFRAITSSQMVTKFIMAHFIPIVLEI